MVIQENISLKSFNTFGINAKARYFSTFSDVDELEELLHAYPQYPLFILGGGSNILFTKDFNGLVLKNEIKGVDEMHEDQNYVYVKAGAGEIWHRFVLHCINNNWAGLENLSLIPGNVGASPMQNIGAYGVELQDVFYCLEAFHRQEKKILTFTSSDCEFGYRESVFKRKYKDQFIILNITLKLRKHPIFHIEYGTLKQELERMGVKELSIRSISQAVINIRKSKLPDPKDLGSAGSFFKNPVITKSKFDALKEKFPGIPSFSSREDRVKIPAGWLIEHCGPEKTESGWKGFRRGDAGCYSKQALVLVNYGNAVGQDIFNLSEEITASVKSKFGITLEREVNII
ncbi:MAG: UDP-N-acetylmuramate dehydrogenase [Bacteroidetes bacterium]|nr:UDP-N-acetylmuramate dehydrogenase [Bacteroidota bacterium]MBS1930213.1 UDP-N-acetylmuramate dehydrogenase [Bacteroidota bacterium]